MNIEQYTNENPVDNFTRIFNKADFDKMDETPSEFKKAVCELFIEK